MMGPLEAIDLLKDAAAGQDVYARILSLRSALAASRGRRLQAASYLLRGVRISSRPDAGRDRVQSLLDACCREGGVLSPLKGNHLLAEFQASADARQLRLAMSRDPLEDRVRLRFPRDEEPNRLGDLILLKKRDPNGGRGVILISYTGALQRFAASFDVARLVQHYSLVFEPSWWGYEDISFLLFVGSDADVIVQCSSRRDYDFISDLRSNMVPIRLGAGEWMDPTLFRPPVPREALYDLVMVSAWSPYKRHREFFATLAYLRTHHNRQPRVALIGYPIDWTRKHVEELMRSYGVSDQCTILESIPQKEVARVVSGSRAYVLVSKREGSNRGLYEALFCDTPVVVSGEHRGVNVDHVNAETGVLFRAGRLADALMQVLDDRASFQPREWAIENAGYVKSTERLNAALRALAQTRGEAWGRDIELKTNSPNPRYPDDATYEYFAAEYQALAGFLLPVE